MRVLDRLLDRGDTVILVPPYSATDAEHEKIATKFEAAMAAVQAEAG